MKNRRVQLTLGFWLGLLSFASGVCGIAYEQLYSRVLTTHLGDAFAVNGSILAVFLLGIGTGSLIAHRAAKYLYLIELFIGVYSVGLAVFGPATTEITAEFFSHITPNAQLGLMLTVGALLIAPATLVGFSIPLFSIYARHYSSQKDTSAFDRTYILYNVGAALCVLMIEFVLLRALGIRATLYFTATINFASAAVLKAWVPQIRTEPAPTKKFRLDSLTIALFLLSIGSGIFQLFFLKITEVVFGPFHENFALVIAMGLIGIALGTLWVEQSKRTFSVMVSDGLVAISLAAALLCPLVLLWATLGDTIALHGPVHFWGRLVILVLIAAPSLSFFGSTVPAALRDPSRTPESAGTLLAISSFGNCVGYLAATLFVFEHLSFLQILLVVFFLVGLAVIVAGGMKLVRSPALPIAAVLLIAVQFTWDDRLFHLSYEEFGSLKELKSTLADTVSYESRRRYDSHVSTTRWRDGSKAVVINGYRSLSVTPNISNSWELLFGMTPAMYLPSTSNALVLGLGTGITVGAVASHFNQTTAIELNPVMVEILDHFDYANMGVAKNPKLKIELDDGIRFMKRSQEKYDAILNTVTSPIYFSSAKLYTREFFELVKARLNPHGVYAMWFDSRLSRRGVKILFKTLSDSFAECHYVMLRGMYSQVLCAADKLPEPRPVASWDPKLVKYWDWLKHLPWNGSHPTINDMMASILFPQNILKFNDWGTEVNTFDFPRLEFSIAASTVRVGHRDDWQPDETFGIDYAAVPFQNRKSIDAVARRCFILDQLNGDIVEHCIARLGEANNGVVPLSYWRSQLAAVERPYMKLRSSRTSLIAAFAKQIANAGYYGEALEALDKIAPELSNNLAFAKLQAAYKFKRDGNLSDAELNDLYFRSPMDRDIRKLMADVTEKRGHKALAKSHHQMLHGGTEQHQKEMRSE